MGYEFNADEIFEMAGQIERNGAKFYREAAARVANESAKALLTEFAKMEDQHEVTFANMRKELTAEDKAATVFDPQSDSMLYLQALADMRVFFKKKMPDMEVSAGRDENTVLIDVLKAAIEAEKDSIVFYLGMRDCVPENLGRPKMEKIIREEMAHIRILSKQLVALKAKA